VKIGILGPIATPDIAHLLEGDTSLLPVGGATAPLMATLISTLIERGHEVVGCTLSALPQHLPKSVTSVTAYGHRLRMHYAPARRHSFRFNGWYPGRMVDFYRRERLFYVEALLAERPDVVHAHWSYEAALAAADSGLPYVVTCHDSPVQVLRFMPNLYRLGRYFMARQALRNVRVATAVSGYIKGEVQGMCRVPVRVIPNPLPAQLMDKRQRAPVTGTELSAPRVATVLNGWSKFKNPEPALEAFAMLRAQWPGATLDLYGYDFGPGERAEAFARKNGLLKGMVFHGMTPHRALLDQLASMHILLHSALEEGCPMALVEAMTVGVVVVGGKTSGGVPWVLDYGRAGVLADVTSAKDLASAMSGLLVDPARYAALVEASQARARTVFDPHVVAAAYEECYQDAIAAW